MSGLPNDLINIDLTFQNNGIMNYSLSSDVVLDKDKYVEPYYFIQSNLSYNNITTKYIINFNLSENIINKNSEPIKINIVNKSGNVTNIEGTKTEKAYIDYEVQFNIQDIEKKIGYSSTVSPDPLDNPGVTQIYLGKFYIPNYQSNFNINGKLLMDLY
jgi:hypothetical protein